jgi:hypothetical protein
MRWNEICRAALILGVIDGYSKGECLKVRKLCMKRVTEGKAKYEKIGDASLWRGVLDQ